MNAREYFQAGQLNDAIKAITNEVKKYPKDSMARGFLCELLLISRAWDRADKQLDLLAHQNPESILGISLWRQLLRAGQARDQYFREGRVPEILECPDALIKMYWHISLNLRESRLHESQSSDTITIVETAEQARPKLSGTVNDQAFEDFRDLDDVAPSVLEVFTSTGKYYWIPFSRIVNLTVYRAESAVDLVLRRAHLEINAEGPEGDVYLPSIYHPLPKEDTERCLLGRTTDWLGAAGEPILGVGQKMFLHDEQTVSIMEINQLTFNQP